jgi:hypothetical protein
MAPRVAEVLGIDHVLLIACLHGGEHRPAQDLRLKLLRV